MIKFFKEFQKPYFEPILGPFAKFGGKMNFPGKKDFVILSMFE